MRTLVIIPTYNERDNIVLLIDQILKLPGNPEVLVIDDGSPDGTAEAVLEGFADHDRVHLIRRNAKMGLGTAYSTGFRYVLESDYTHCITMDADFSHDPGHIPEMCEAANRYDMILGSRYVPGGKTVNWGRWRRLISRTANLLAHNVLALRPADCTTGFRLYRRQALYTLEFETIVADGYSYLVEALYRASRCGLKVGEVPIVFVERRRGKSKISRKEILKAVGTILRLRFTSWERSGEVTAAI